MKKKVLIPGREEAVKNYVAAVFSYGAVPVVFPTERFVKDYDLLLLPGGGDIDPSFFNQKNNGSVNIDYELDKAQFYLLDLFVTNQKPVLGICKGMQLINIYFGGNIVQNMNSDKLLVHSYQKKDSIHAALLNSYATLPPWLPYTLFPKNMQVNSAHHQCINHLGDNLTILQFSPDFVPEAIVHTSFKILGLQWHPERLHDLEPNALHPFLDCLLKDS